MDTLFNVGTLSGLTDRELLDRFLDEPGATGQEAFRSLVSRHGPMVLGFCRSMLKNPHEAEDAFQATFLVLVRRARSIWIRDSVGPWLYAVAGRVARRARRQSLRRQKLEVSTVPEIPSLEGSGSDWLDTYQGIHEEITRLPTSLRGPIVLCCLEGLNYDLAANRLGLTEPTLRGRLHRARKRLASRLRERGLTEPAMMVAIEPFRVNLPTLPPALIESTVRFSMRWSSIQGLLGMATDIPDSVTALARAVVRAMPLFAGKLTGLTGLLATCALGTAVLAQQGKEAAPKPGGIPPRVKPSGIARPRETVSQAPRRQYELLIEEVKRAQERYSEEYTKLKTEEERAAYARTNFPAEQKVVGRFLELARAHPQDPVAFDALTWVALLGFATPESETAATLLARDYPRDKRLWIISEDMRRMPITMAREPLLRAVIEHNPDRDTRGRACLDLAQFLMEEAEFVQLLKMPGLKPWHAQFYPEERLARFRSLDVKLMTDDAEHLLQRVLDEFPGVVPVKWWTVTPPGVGLDSSKIYRSIKEPERESGTLADRARPALAEVRTLGLGKTAPEIEGTDIDGHRFKLSDYRGKVVVLDFAGTWCGFCKQMYPEFRELVKRYKDRPFTLLGVMADEDKTPLQREIAAGEITWQCWWESGGAKGRIPRDWNVHAYPRIYILDHQGVIRLKFTGQLGDPGTPDRLPRFAPIIESLLKECGGAAKP